MSEKRFIQNLARDNRALRREVLKSSYSKPSTKTTIQQAENRKIQYKNDMNLKMRTCLNKMFSLNLLLVVYLMRLDKLSILCFKKIQRVITIIKITITELFTTIKVKLMLKMQKLIKRITMYNKPRCKKDSIEEYQDLIKRKIMSNIRFKFRDHSLNYNTK